MRAAIYCRVSSSMQRDAKTIETQLRILPEFVAARGWTLAREPYIDDGASAKAGRLDKREAFARLLADVAARLFDVVVVLDFDRLTRSEDLAERGVILGALQRSGVRLAVASTGQVLDLSSSVGDFMSAIAAVQAAEENRLRRERAIRGHETSARRGHLPSGPAPYGYTFTKSDGWRVNEQEAAIVREIFARMVAGESGNAIGHDLTERGVPTPRGGRWGWGVRNLLHSTTYRGEFRANARARVVVKVPPLVDDATWYAAQEALLRSKLGGLDRTKHVYLIDKIAVCGVCGAAIWTMPPPSSKTKFYYMCSERRSRRGGARCALPGQERDATETAVWGVIVDWLLRPGLAAELAEACGDASEDASRWARDLAAYEERLLRLEAAQAAIVRQLSRGLVTERVADAELENIARDRAFLARQVETARAASADAGRGRATSDEVLAKLAELRAALPLATREERREIVRLLVPGTARHRITLHHRRAEVGLFLPLGGIAGAPASLGANHPSLGLEGRLVAVHVGGRRQR